MPKTLLVILMSLLFADAFSLFAGTTTPSAQAPAPHAAQYARN